uniref:Isoform 2 of Tetratricopeptide repeat protein 24 n=1 Tax=Mus musculus TaxID=10090 RepID=Q8BYG0-2|nr:Ttc24 protein [Mus musculus]
MATGWGWCSKKTPGAVSLPSAPGKLQTSRKAKTSARVQSSAEDAQESQWEGEASEGGHEKKEMEGLVNTATVLGPQRQNRATTHLPSGGPSPSGEEYPFIIAPKKLRVSRSSTWAKEALGRNFQRTRIQSGLCSIM